MPVKGKSFGQERPPLTDLLKNILLRYPDGGQILKELIQNADDAGANEVKVLFDATSYGTASLVSPELALFQGPALYCYNNAEFTNEDWEGLRRLMKGSKQDNPLKVGRFGVGFNSVYHITDLPSIASGDTVAFLDPHEKYIVRGEPGRAFSTKDPLLTEHFDQFHPFHQMFDCNLSQGNHYNGTLFRFPLRTQSSKLSDKIYTKDMVDGLFDSFKNEATAILLFLKSVDSISFYEKEKQGKISHLYTAKVSEKSKTEVRNRRQELIQDITLDWDFAVRTTFYRLEIEEKCLRKPTEKNEWFLANQVGTNEMKLVKLARNSKLFPWIGIAFPVNSNNTSLLGRIFCFLPLPPDCRTGLPVQMNGYFGLTDNRRALKWPGPDCQNDETAQWNQLLLEKVGSQVYANLIVNMTRQNSGNFSSELLAKLVYSALPICSSVREEWRCILQQFFRTVLTKEIFFTTATGNSRWITLGKAIIDRLDESEGMRKEVKQVVLRTLLSAGQPIVSLPAHVLQVIDQYHQISGWKTLHKVTPALLCDVLRSKFDFHKLEMPFQHKLFVLEYALQNVPGNISNLYNVPLLPLENRQFIKFSHPSIENIFIPSVKHSADLLPNLKHRLLYRNLPLQVQQKLNELANSKATQLHHPTAHDIKQLLWQNLPDDWSSSYPMETVSWNPNMNGHPSLAWLELIWKWINENYPRNLAEFEGMPLIPVGTSSMARIFQNSAIIVAKHPMCNETLSGLVREFLTKSGCILVKKLPSFVKHVQLFNYVALPNPSGILRILLVTREKVVQQLALASNKVKEELCSILSRLEGIDWSQKLFIRTLPIFVAVNGNHFVSCQTERDEQRLVAPRNLFIPAESRIIDRTNILSSSKDESYRLLQKLDMKIESTAGLIRSHLENFLNSGIKNAEKDKLVLWILAKIDVLHQEMSTFVTFMGELACIPTASGERIAPSKLFDDSDELLIRLLQDNNMAFPTSRFSEPIRRRKSELHVRRKENLMAQDVLLIVNRLTEPELSLDRGMALVELMNQRPQLLKEYCGDGVLLRNFLRDFPWFPRVLKPPTNYPDFMPWYDGLTLCKPSSMQSNLLALLVGATVPVFDDRLISRDVKALLGMSQTRNVLTEVIGQLQLAIFSWTNLTTPTSGLILANFEEMVKVLYTYLCEAPKDAVEHLLQSKGLTQWVWHGRGFASPEKVALESHFPKSINICPYLYRLPNELFKIKNFLLSLGVKPQFTVDDLLDMLWSIKAKHDEKTQEPEAMMFDLDQCRAVLEWIVESGDDLCEERRSKLLIPVQAKSDKLQLEPCDTCTFCDREFLRRGVSEYGISIKSYLIHKAISEDLASRLRVPRLSSCLAKAKAVGIKFKEAGQYEPLTTRLRNILQQYKEGVVIFKELIQNADDAGASKVCFVVDWRENRRVKLLAEELSKCQGPALWAYNDAMFSESDFENINKLAGETKKEDLDKVGRFGLGFNSVYHLTDIPSFVSGEHVVIFDPNMNHISQLIDDKMRKGGLMLSLVENKDALSAFPDQFSPYDQLFGCNMSGTGTFHFQGTLFRLPFRTIEQAQESEISQEPYTPDNVYHLIKSLKESASTLLLFAQNVKEVRVFEIRKNSTPKKSLGRPIVTITKSVEKILRTNVTEGTMLQNSSSWLLKNRPSGAKALSDAPHRTQLLKMNVSMVKSDLGDVSELSQKEDTWLVNSCTGQGSSFQVAQSVDGKRNGVVPITGVAAKTTHSMMKIFPVTGEVFCFMPLSIESGFPVHVNGFFTVHPNRRRLWEEGMGEHQSLKPFEAKWNRALMEDSLVQAYLQLLKMLASYNDKQYEFHSLWPNPTKVNYPKAWKPLLNLFFSKIIDEEWPLFYCNGSWRKLQNCLILDPKLNKVADSVTIMNLLGENVLLLPKEFMEAFKSSGKAQFIEDHMLTEDRFLREFFFSRVTQIPNPLRNSVLVYILDRRLSKHRSYDDLLQTYPCFSCSEGGKLRKPNELVHPKGKVACLFSEVEKRFPLDARFLEKERAMMLEELGMIIDFLPWCALCERAEWISKQCDVKKAGLLIQVMNRMPSDCKITDEESRILRATKFLPVLSKPEDYPFSWKSDEFHATLLATAENLYLEAHKYLVGSRQLILDESSNRLSVPNKSLKKILGLASKQPELSDVIAQLDFVIKSSYQLTGEKKEYVCSKIYFFLQKIITTEKCKSQLSYLREQLQCRSWMLVRDQMVDAKQVAKNWNKEDGSPYLFRLPHVYSRKFKDLIQWYKVKDKFSQKDFIEAIVQLRKSIDREKMLDDQIRTLIVLLEEVFRSSNTKPVMSLPLPSADGQLHDADKLVFNKTPWLETDSVNKLVHEKVPILLAYKCGANDLRNADLIRCSEPIAQSFGQHEKLTERLKNILSAYSADVGILKELLQNADDAEANEIHFVFDPRTHNSERIFSAGWKDLQGPAICVYNDKPFSKEDLEGIQKLGIGSKVHNPVKTGQYGIGFNAVYHLTDCPYFISDDKVICVSDPHTEYVPGATEDKPGRLFPNLNKLFRRNYQDVLAGFLGDHFKLEGSTMFRFPLRRASKSQSDISTEKWDEGRVKKLFSSFRESAKQMLLFLNSVTKISISEIKNGELKTYSVMSNVSDNGKRDEFFEKVRAYSKEPTREIHRHQIHYVLKIQDTKNIEMDWLVTQSLGYDNKESKSQVPNGTEIGLLPLAGIAICLSSTESARFPLQHSIFCVLPLPISTKLPAHINGHFALGSSRRCLWHDCHKPSDKRVVWNDFMKRQVIAPAYASAICHARQHIPDYRAKSNTSGAFPSRTRTENGLKWYHQLFPCIADLDEVWKPVGEMLYKYFLPMFPVLPVAMSVPEWKNYSTDGLSSCNSEPEPDDKPVNVTWCRVGDAYFCTYKMSCLLQKTLLEIGFRLLSHTPEHVHKSFNAAEFCQDVNPEQVRVFLYEHREIKDPLPIKIKETVLHDVHNVCELTTYCAEAKDFFKNLEGLPLLLTQDGILRCFHHDSLVFFSKFSQLLPSRQDLFIHDLLENFYASNVEKCSEVVREFLVPDLAKFQFSIFPSSWITDTASHQPWNPDEQDNRFPSKEWLKLLWEFIGSISKSGSDIKSSSKSENKTSNILKEIFTWHIIPTTHDCLVPLSMGKTVLDVNSFFKSDSPQDETRRKLLDKLGCPHLDHTFLDSSFSGFSGATAVRKQYLATIQSTKDVLHLLDKAVNGGAKKEAKLENFEIEQLFMFLQSDLCGLSRSLLCSLPFYETISHTYTRLSACNKVYEVPVNVPDDDLEVLSEETRIVFLRHAPKVTDLYRHTGIKKVSSAEFYRDVILKYFNYLTSKGRENHMQYVKNHLLNSHHDGYKPLLDALRPLSFIPDHVGKFHLATDFYDSDNKVFTRFLPEEKFPPKPFDSGEWKEFLKKVGLQCTITKDLFKKFAKQLEEEARNYLYACATSDEAKEILQKSSILVSHLLENKSLHAKEFLSQISKVSFVPAAIIEKSYLEIHPLHTKSILTCFSGSVVGTHKLLVWSSSSLIEASVVSNRPKDVIKKLGIHWNPPHKLVILHTQNISSRFYARNEEQNSSKLKPILLEVMTDIYSYFSKSCDMKSGPPNAKCSANCKLTQKVLQNVPVILLDQLTLLRGSQVAFNGVQDTMKPYMFNIPRHLQHFEHFLKCLGAQEHPTPLQCASVLEAVQKSCGNNRMHLKEIPVAVEAAKCLFISLSKEMKKRHPNAAHSLKNVRSLYLPTADDYLMPSSEVFFNDNMEKKGRLQDYSKVLLIDLTMKDQEPPAKLIKLLPSHLKVKTLSSNIVEKLSESHINNTCIRDQDPTASSCEFIKRYRDIICSREFSKALIRLFKFQEDKIRIPKHVENDLRILENNVKISCRRTIDTELVVKATMEPIPGSVANVSTFCEERYDKFVILIKHGGDRNREVLHDKLCSFISLTTGQHISEAKWHYLMLILSAKDPWEISKILNDAGVPRSFEESINPGDRIPEHSLYLLRHDISYDLQADHLVGFETREESKENGTVYLYAKIIKQTSPGDGIFAFNSKYIIDIGVKGQVEVRKLKLYNFDREDQAAANSTTESMQLESSETNYTPEDGSPVEPGILEDAKEEVAEALREIFSKLPDEERSGAVKRLIRRWHPDRQGPEKFFATDVTGFLLNEVERLKKEERTNNYEVSVDCCRAPEISEYLPEPADRNKAKRWMRQAQIDYDAANYLFQSHNEPYYSFTCFHCQQAVEKALKALMFAKGLIKREDLAAHDVLDLAYRAQKIDSRLCGIPSKVEIIDTYIGRTRYPDCYDDENSIPAEKFTAENAQHALSETGEILELLQQVMDYQM